MDKDIGSYQSRHFSNSNSRSNVISPNARHRKVVIPGMKNSLMSFEEKTALTPPPVVSSII